MENCTKETAGEIYLDKLAPDVSTFFNANNVGVTDWPCFCFFI